MSGCLKSSDRIGSSNLFRNFNDNSFNRIKQNLTIYAIEFDLADLVKHTNSSSTKYVLIRADTVYTTKKIHINFKLVIRARRVVLKHPIIMKLPVSKFKNLKVKMMYEKHVLFDNSLPIRHRIYGLVDISDVAPPEFKRYKYKKCIPHLKNSSDVNIQSWFDPVIVDMIYICCNTMVTNSNKSSLGTFYQRH